jgi:dCMP deaminase
MSAILSSFPWLIPPSTRGFKNWDKMYMDIAIRVAEESKCPRNKVGSCILLESGLLSTGINGFPEGQEEQWTDGSESNSLVTHSELNAMGKLLEEGVSCKNATVYITLSPCVDCSKLLVRAKVKRVVYLEEYRCAKGLNYLRKYGVIVEQFKGE